MSQYFNINAQNPQPRLIAQAAAMMRQGGIVALPTDASYVLACVLGCKQALDKIRSLRHLPKNHYFTLMCRDYSEVANYAKVDNQTFKLLKACLPGPYTFILKATKEVPSRLLHPKRKTIGIRMPDYAICSELITAMGEPIMTTSLREDGDEIGQYDAYQIYELHKNQLDLTIEGDSQHLESTTVIDLTDESPILVRQGIGPVDDLFN